MKKLIKNHKNNIENCNANISLKISLTRKRKESLNTINDLLDYMFVD